MTELSASKVYFDANVFIYAVEGSENLAGSIRKFISGFHSKSGRIITSEITLAEVLVKANVQQRRDYLDLILWSGFCDLRHVDRQILFETASYRRASGIPKLIDAIHVVTAIQNNCQTVMSSDARIKLPIGMSRVDASSDNLARLNEDLS